MTEKNSINKKEHYRKIIGNVIRTRRQKKNVTQKELGNALGLKDHTMISKIENGHKDIAASELPVICELLDFKMRDFSDKLDYAVTDEPLQKLISKAQRSRMCNENMSKLIDDSIETIREKLSDAGQVNSLIGMITRETDAQNDLSLFFIEFCICPEKQNKETERRLTAYYRAILEVMTEWNKE